MSEDGGSATLRLIDRHRSLATFLGFFYVALIIRLPTFFQSVIDHDESTYIIIGKAIFAGSALYTDVWDTKPAGIFVLFGLVQRLFGDSIVTIRLFATLTIALTALLLYWAKRREGRPWAGAALSGLLYVLMVSAHGSGLAANVEIFFVFFTAAALTFLVGGPTRLGAALAGLMLGLGFIVKYVVLFDALALGCIFLLLGALKERARRRELLLSALLFSFAFALPFAALNAIFYLGGHYADFSFATYVVPGRYATVLPLAAALAMVARFHRDHYLVLVPFYLYCFHLARDRQLARLAFPLTWFLLAWAAVLLPGKTFPHYLIQLMLPVAYFVPDLFVTQPQYKKLAQAAPRGLVVLLLLSYVLVLSSGYKRRYLEQRDVPREVAAFLQPKLKPGDTIFTANFAHILYHLLGVPSPTKYVHHTLLTKRSRIEALGIDPQKELQKILAKQPRFVVTVGRYPHELLNRTLEEDYRIIKLIDRVIFVFERKAPP